MEVVTISPKFQVVIPAALRKSLALKPGEKLQVVEHEDGEIGLRRLRPMEDYEGILAGIENDFEREADRV